MKKSLSNRFYRFFKVIYIDKRIADKVIELRQHKKIKLPDAIIAATALVRKCDLMTRNINDFNNIDDSLNVLNPFAINQAVAPATVR